MDERLVSVCAMRYVKACEGGWGKHRHPGVLNPYHAPVTRTRSYRSLILIWEEPPIEAPAVSKVVAVAGLPHADRVDRYDIRLSGCR